MAIKRINQTDQLDNANQKIDENFQEFVTAVTNTTSGHDHDGTDSKTVDHTNLLNKGTKSHSTIDSDIGTLQSGLSNHIGDSTPHASADEKSDWNAVVSEVETARTSTTNGAYASLDARLEAIETASSPSSHQSLTNRATEATQLSDSTHPASTVWDETGNQHVQDTLDDYDGRLDDLETDCAFKATIIETINDTSETEKIALAKIETIAVADENVTCGTTPAPLGGGTTSDLNQEEVNDTARRVWVPNLVPNGLWIFQGLYYTGGQAYNARGFNSDAWAKVDTLTAGSVNAPYGIPRWRMGKTSTYANSSARHQTSGPTGTGSEFDGLCVQITGAQDGTHSGNNTTAYFRSDTIPVMANKVHTINFYYKWTSGANKITPVIYIKQGGTTLVSENLTTGSGSWVQVRKIFTPTASSITIEFPANSTDSAAHDYFIGPIGIWEGDYTNGELPRTWYNREVMAWPGHGDYGSTDTAPSVGAYKTCKSRYHVEIPVSSSLSAPLTVNIPSTVYVYDVKITADYALSAIPYWDAPNAVNFRTPFSTVSVTVAAPASAGNIFLDIDYWPVIE